MSERSGQNKFLPFYVLTSMEKKRRITFYADLNGPYRQFLRDGMDMTPNELFDSFMRMRVRNRLMFGLKKKTNQRLTIHKPSWM